MDAVIFRNAAIRLVKCRIIKKISVKEMSLIWFDNIRIALLCTMNSRNLE